MYTLYEHKNKLNGKIYIGITKQEPEHRWGSNGINYKSSPYFYSAIIKYGWNNFDHLIILTNLTEKEACKMEREYIYKYHTQDRRYGYNILDGGQITNIPNDVKEKMSKSMIGNKNGLGHPCSEEKKEKISKAQRGRCFTNEHKNKLSIAASKRHVPCSEEKKRKLSKNYPYKKKVYCYETNTIYDSVQECARELHLYPTNVSKVCRKINHTTGGYHLDYYNNVINA